jgi:hypothetical protein
VADVAFGMVWEVAVRLGCESDGLAVLGRSRSAGQTNSLSGSHSGPVLGDEVLGWPGPTERLSSTVARVDVFAHMCVDCLRVLGTRHTRAAASRTRAIPRRVWSAR